MPVVINEFDVVTDQSKEQQQAEDPCAEEKQGPRSPGELRDTLRGEWERLWRVRAF